MDGYTDEEIQMFEQLLRKGAGMFYKYAELGGMTVAKSVTQAALSTFFDVRPR